MIKNYFSKFVFVFLISDIEFPFILKMEPPPPSRTNRAQTMPNFSDLTRTGVSNLVQTRSLYTVMGCPSYGMP